MRVTLALWLSLILTLDITAESRESELSETQKQKLVEAIGKRLNQKAYAFETDFSSWAEHAENQAQEISEAKTKRELATVLASALDEFQLSHLGLFAPSTAKLRRSGKRAGVGVTIHPLEQGGGLISYVIANSPAQRSGLQKGDVLTHIDDTPLTHIKQLAGTVGQIRQIRWKRGESELSGKIEYETFLGSEPSKMRWLSDEIALIRIQSFQYRFYRLSRINRFFREARNAEAIILDLRNNRGGLSLYSRHLASKLSKPKTIFALQANKRRSEKGFKKVHPLPFSKAYRGKIIVLTDSLSASAADLVPAFVSETGRGIVIGQKTSGALQLARSYPLPYGFRIYLPIADMLTPKGNRLESVGFTPDIELSLEETINDEKILAVAIDQIRSDQFASEE